MIQHHFAQVLDWVQDGEEVQVTRRHKVVAKIISCQDKQQTVEHPDFLARAQQIWGKQPKGMTLSDAVGQDRGERI